ncbi:MAG: nuclear transport factor 2 family protein [Pseudomonadota bacterium]
MSSSDLVQDLTDRLAIEEVLARYCRGIDRCDADALTEVFTADAQIDYGDGATPIAEAIASLMSGLRAMKLTQHNIGNIICALEAGGKARCETYCVALHIIPGEPDVEVVVGGRYLDTLTKTDGTWKIAERRYIMDWNRNGPASMQTSGGLYDTLMRRGDRFPSDPSYAWWASERDG